MKTERIKTILLTEVPLLRDCMSDGETQIEALTNIEEAKEVWLADAIGENLPIPEPVYA